MIKEQKTVTQLCNEAYQTAKEKGFHDKQFNTGEKLMLIVSELGEALEADRKNKNVIDSSEFHRIETLGLRNIDTHPDDSFNREFPKHIKDTFEDELADACIRIFDLAGSLGIDLDWHIQAKMKYNKSREKLHGKSY